VSSKGSAFHVEATPFFYHARVQTEADGLAACVVLALDGAGTLFRARECG
jgi:hypothetical protein